MKAPTRRRLTLMHTKVQVRAEILEFPPKYMTTARVRGQNPSSSAWEQMASGVSLGSHDSSAATTEASSGKPLEGFGGHGRPLLLISTTRARPDAFRILEELKPH